MGWFRRKTTLEIEDSLLAEAKRVAAKEKTSLRALVEEALRRALRDRRNLERPFRLKLVTATGPGLAPGVSLELPRHLAYRGSDQGG